MKETHTRAKEAPRRPPISYAVVFDCGATATKLFDTYYEASDHFNNLRRSAPHHEVWPFKISIVNSRGKVMRKWEKT